MLRFRAFRALVLFRVTILVVPSFSTKTSSFGRQAINILLHLEKKYVYLAGRVIGYSLPQPSAPHTKCRRN